MNTYNSGRFNLRGIALFVFQYFPNMDLVAADGMLIQNSPVEILSIFQLSFPQQGLKLSEYFDQSLYLHPSVLKKISDIGAKCILSYPNNNESAPPLYCQRRPFNIKCSGEK